MKGQVAIITSNTEDLSEQTTVKDSVSPSNRIRRITRRGMSTMTINIEWRYDLNLPSVFE